MKCLMSALALGLASLSSVALATGDGLSDLETDLTLRLVPPSGGEDGVFGIVKPSAAASSAVSYTLGTGSAPGEIQFNVSDRMANTLDNPLFCFDTTPSGNAQLLMNIETVGGQTAMNELGITSAVQYVLTGGEIVVTPPSLARCFYRGQSGDFGLFGVPPVPQGNGSDVSSDAIFADSFEAEVKLSIEFSGWGSTAGTGSVTYNLEIVNQGRNDIQSVSFQEAYPSSLDFYPVALGTGGVWDCGNDLNGEGLLRVEGANIPVDGSITCSITRNVSGSGTLRLYAAAVAGSGANTAFDVDEVEVTVD